MNLQTVFCPNMACRDKHQVGKWNIVSHGKARQLRTVSERVFLVGCLYNFCWFHTSLDNKTPVMAAGLTDHRWSLEEFLWQPLLPYFASTA